MVALFVAWAGAALALAQDQPVAGSLRPLRLPRRAAGATLETIRQPTRSQTLRPGLFTVQRRAALAFEPFAMVDPKTGAPVAPTATITLPDGRTFKAKDYYDELNSFERWLTEQGYSLRLPEPPSAIEALSVDKGLLERQLRTAPRPTDLLPDPRFLGSRTFKTLSRTAPLHLARPRASTSRTLSATTSLSRVMERVNGADLTVNTRDGNVVKADSLARIAGLLAEGPLRRTPQPAPACTNVDESRSWSWNVGDKGKFNAYVNGMLSLTGQACKPPDMKQFKQNKTHFKLGAEGKAGGYVFGVGGDILRLTGSMEGDQSTQHVSANLSAFVMGQNVYHLTKQATGHWGIDDSVSKGVDFSTSFTVPVGPIPVSVTLGAQGSAGLSYSLNLNPMDASASAGPFVHTSVYGQGGVGVPHVLSGGLGVSMTLVDWDAQLGVTGGVGWFWGFLLNHELYGQVTLSMLDGKVYAYVEVGHPCFDLPPWCTSKYSTNLWSWDGYHYNSVVFHDKAWTPLHW